MKPPSLSTLKIKNLRDQLLCRSFAIPKLQRNFVWDAGRAAKLLDSIYREMPIGSLFLWEMDRKSANLIRQSTEVLPPFSHANPIIWFVIDGQQRLSVIHQAFEGEDRENDAGKTIRFSRLCFVVKPNGRDEPRIVYRKPVDGELIPLKDILAPDWRRRMTSRSAPLLRKVEDCRRRLLEYPVPVVTVRSATLDEIGEVFVRVNSQGMRITSADRAIALMGRLDIRSMAEELRRRVRDRHFAMGTIDPILMAFNLVSESHADGTPPKLTAMAARWSKRIEASEHERQALRRLWDKMQRGFLNALDYLRRRFHVYDESYLPSGNMVATLSVFFFHHAGQPNRHQSAEIRKWFWGTGVGQRYTGRGYHRNIIADAKLFERLAQGKPSRFELGERIEPGDIQRSEYGSRSARSRAFFCLLAAQKPRYLDNGEELPLGPQVFSHQNSNNRHHIFPQAQLRHHFSSKDYHSLCNICFLVARDNILVGKKLPKFYLDEYSHRRHFAKTMASHLIPVKLDSGVWNPRFKDGYRAFRQQRLQMICAAFEKEAGMRLFRKE